MNEHDVPAKTFDVAVIGYGPTGLALACWLGAAGHRTVMIERWPDLYTLPRAGHVDGEIMRLFQKLGVAESIAEDSSVVGPVRVRDADGDVLGTIPPEECKQGWAAHYSLYQPNLERVLDERVRATGNVTILQGWQAESISAGAGESVRIRIASGVGQAGQWIATGKSTEVAARWLIGADGANSLVAGFVGSKVEDLGFQARALVIFAERLEPSIGSTMPDSEVGMLLSRPYIALRESGKRFARWEFLVLPDESTDEMNEVDKAWELIAPWGFAPENSRLVRHTVFEFRTLLADSWRKDNMLLAGDAAHRMPPHNGQGMCSGQRDAAALAWRLDLVLRGVSSPELLDSYTPERRPHVLEVTRNSAERAAVFWNVDPGTARERDAAMRQGMSSKNFGQSYGAVPPLSDGVLFRGADGPIGPAGELSPQFRVRCSGVEMLLDDHVGGRWLLIVTDPSFVEGLGADDQQLVQRLGARVWVLGDEDSDIADVDGDYARWLSELGCGAVLIRPDSYIFGGAETVADVRSLLSSLTAHLHLRDVSV